jgi:hypothetical protein
MEPLVNDRITRVGRDVLERMLSELPEYDEYHLVYALELGAIHSPASFIPRVPPYLAHPKMSVSATAIRILDQVQEKYVTQDLVNSVRSARRSDPTKEWIADILDRLERRFIAKREQQE